MDFVYVINPQDKTPPPPVTAYLPDLDRPSQDLPPLPESFRIRRGFGVSAQEYGPYTAEEVTTYLAQGLLTPDDYYFSTAENWQALRTTGLCG